MTKYLSMNFTSGKNEILLKDLNFAWHRFENNFLLDHQNNDVGNSKMSNAAKNLIVQ